MTRKERLERCFFQQEIDRPAIYSRSGFPKNDPTYDDLKKYLVEYTELKAAWGPQEHPPEGVSQESREEEYSEDFSRRITTLHTPKGDLWQTRLVGLKGQPGLEETPFLKTREDAEKFLSQPFPEREDDASAFFEKQREMGDKGIVQVNLGRSPAGLAAGLFGSEEFAIKTVTDRDIIHELCKRQQEYLIDRVKFAFSKGTGPFFCTAGEEFVAPPLHGAEDFREFITDYEKPIIDLIHDNGGALHIHCHGSIKKVIDQFVEMGTDVLHPFEAPPSGDIQPAEAKAAAKDSMCLEGNIQIQRLYEGTPEDIADETEALIQDTFYDNKGLIVCPTASPYIYGQGEVCFPQYKAMIDTVLAKGNCTPT